MVTIQLVDQNTATVLYVPPLQVLVGVVFAVYEFDFSPGAPFPDYTNIAVRVLDSRAPPDKRVRISELEMVIPDAVLTRDGDQFTGDVRGGGIQVGDVQLAGLAAGDARAAGLLVGDVLVGGIVA